MNFDLIFGGVGGQGILSIAYVLDNAALRQELRFKQSEVHGMAQRGGAVSSHLRVSDREIFSDMVPLASAHLLLGVEPMETLRYLDYLRPDGRIVSSVTPEVNIPDYPEVGRILDVLLGQPGTVLLDGKKVAREAGSHRAQNMVVLGAAAPYIPLPQPLMEQLIEQLFQRKGEKVVRANLNAFRYGKANGEFFLACVEAGADAGAVLTLMQHLESASLEPTRVDLWCQLLRTEQFSALVQRVQKLEHKTIPGAAEMARQLLERGVEALPG